MISLIKKLADFGWELYEIYIIKRGKQFFFLVFIIFLLTILLSRCIVIWIEADRPFLNFFRASGYHIHHFYLGIFLIILANSFLLLWSKKKYIQEIKVLSSILFGAGLGLITDEFGLLLTMEFDIKGEYWASHSYYLMGIISGIFLTGIIVSAHKKRA